MAAKQPSVGIDHPTVVPTNLARADEEATTDPDDAGEESADAGGGATGSDDDRT